MSNVLVAVDTDGASDSLIDFVGKHSWSPQTNFRIITVCPWMPPESQLRESKDLQRWLEDVLKERKQVLEQSAERIRQSWGENKYQLGTMMLQGVACELILEVAEAWPADLVLVGSHGRKGFDRFLFGSVSGAIIGKAPCSVIVIKPARAA